MYLFGTNLQCWSGIEEHITPHLERCADFDAQSAFFSDWQRHTARQAPSRLPAFQQGQIDFRHFRNFRIASYCHASLAVLATHCRMASIASPDQKARSFLKMASPVRGFV